ncbi:acetyl-CoA carboxylase biotin carboxyl carrier protein [Litchfieldia salsa]|uniref:Biotin carboxyl carrier protein of acetyl-CoA carboxylase n=1 Tax=Litchfieldia salsa TaxID=930152 RepID=A0A1H0WIG5_9BACI|nr:acetyl-CoA carboxylase biotin carboxyl carrier protein [Litchfieldia salsa]SDP90514.1 acetyl-CoA carboxylase biotin carboxyl carrier protein [Litchfieldia salsa]
MLKIQEIRELIKLIDESSIDEFSFEHEGSKLKMKKVKEVVVQPTVNTVVEQIPQPMVGHTPQAAPASQKESQSATAPVSPSEETGKENLHKITSPMVGTFYSSPSPDAPVYANIGDKVSADTVVCIVEAMKLFNEIEAEVAGEIVEVLVENGQLVEYGQPLFLVKA